MAQARVPVIHDGKQVAVTITRAKFDELTRHLLESTITLTKRVIDTARELGCPTIDRMLLVGGSTKMPQVSARLREEFDFEITSFDPDQAVAKGCGDLRREARDRRANPHRDRQTAR
jgi:molecular chaperone DnaK